VIARWFIQESKTAPTAPQSCSRGSCGNGLPVRFSTSFLYSDDRPPVVCLEVGVHGNAEILFLDLQRLLEIVVTDVEHDVGVHLDEAAVAIVGEALVAGRLGEAQHRLVVEAEVQNRVHHARHRGTGTRAHRDQERIGGIAELDADDLLDLDQRLLDLVLQFGRIGLLVVVKVGADLGGDGEAGWHRQAEARHLGQVGTLATQQVAHVGAAFGLAIPETVDPLGHS
jgi:hypothetical protein